MRDTSTTKPDQLKRGAQFTWGHVVAIHEIGPYAIVEYIEYIKKDGQSIRPHFNPSGPHLFHVYADGDDKSVSMRTLEGALAQAMAAKWDGENSQAGYFFEKMIGVKP